MKKSNPLFNLIVSVVSLALVGTAVFISSINSASKQAMTASEPADTNQPLATAPPTDTNTTTNAPVPAPATPTKTPTKTTSSNTAPKTTTTTTTPKPTPAPAPAPTPAPAASKYTNGTYSTTISYPTPDGSEDMKVSLTINNDVVTDSSVTMYAYSGDSRRYQNAFSSNYKPYVVGKNIDSIHLSRVSGASLTTAGFNDALAQIKSQAL